MSLFHVRSNIQVDWGLCKFTPCLDIKLCVTSLCLIRMVFFLRANFMTVTRMVCGSRFTGATIFGVLWDKILISGLNCVYITSRIVLIQQYTEIETGSYQ
jgi:hypothetical protein